MSSERMRVAAVVPGVALALLVALAPTGTASLLAGVAAPSSCCCCEGDCPDDGVQVSRTMPCCKPAPAPVRPVDPPAYRSTETVPVAAHLERPSGATSPVAAVDTLALRTAAPLRGVPLFRLNASLLI